MYWFLSVDANSFAEGTGFVPEGNDFFMESTVFPGSTGFLAEFWFLRRAYWFGILLASLRHFVEVVGHQFLTGDSEKCGMFLIWGL